MSQRDELCFKFSKPNDSMDEAEVETSHIGSPSSNANMSIQSNSSEVGSKSRIRLAVSELSMKLAQRIEEKYQGEVEVSSPEKILPKPTDRFKKLALDVSKNVKVSYSCDEF